MGPDIGGYTGITILRLFSQIEHANFSDQDIKASSKRIAVGGDEVVKANAGNGSATLSMCYTAAVSQTDCTVEDVSVHDIGGHAGITILRLFSQIENANFSDEDIKA